LNIEVAVLYSDQVTGGVGFCPVQSFVATAKVTVSAGVDLKAEVVVAVGRDGLRAVTQAALEV